MEAERLEGKTFFYEYTDRESWLAGRRNSIGASEIAAAIGLSPFMSALELWKIKTGRQEPKDLSTNARVVFGSKAEGLIRDLFILEHPQYSLFYRPYRVYFNEDTPFLTATLDGELYQENGTWGIYEGKTSECTNKLQWAKWDKKIPDNYYAQLCQQLWCGGDRFKFSVLNAKIKGLDGNSVIRNYEFARENMEDDIAYIVESAKKFWWYVENDVQPPLVLKV